MKPYGIPVERINQGKAIIAPTHLAWENENTCNAAAVYLERGAHNDEVIRGLLERETLDGLPDGVVAVHYRAISAKDSGHPVPFSSTGLAVFTPDFRLLRRFTRPVLTPSAEEDSFDYFGIEDPRITRIDNTFYMLYCGPHLNADHTLKTRLCLATSMDLIHWEKKGPIPGGPDRWNNKDGVLFPQPIDGRYYLLHRPWGDDRPVDDFSIWLASSRSLLGEWEEHGEILHSYTIPGCRASWVGAGSVPIALGEKRFLVIYHTGNYLMGNDREYDVGAALFDFNRFTPQKPGAVMVSRVEPLMAPETPCERRVLPQYGQLDVIFPCGSYQYQGFIYMVYGASDIYVAAARVNQQALVAALEKAGLENPYLRNA
jgi:predicted GH43/DUF377 family glycosyl hydrolase